MLPKSGFTCLAAAAFVATTAMLPTVALAAHIGGGFGAGNYPQPGTYNWPPYTETNCGYVWLNSHRQTSYGQWVYRCH
jgi:hypothetical protein